VAGTALRHWKQFEAAMMAAWSAGRASACHRLDWKTGSWDRIPPGYRLVV
jgi:hypothetical protein